MEKKTIIIISVVSAIFSLLYALLNYYGISRYIYLQAFSLEGYTTSYQTLEKIGKNKIVLQLIATSSEFSKLDTVVKSLLDQTVRVDSICLNVAEDSKYELPDNLKNVVSIFTHSAPNSLLPVILRERENTTQIITLGCNTIYGKDFIETLIETCEKYPETIIYENTENYIDLRHGVVFSTKFFNQDFFDLTETDENNYVNNYFINFPKHKITYTENF